MPLKAIEQTLRDFSSETDYLLRTADHALLIKRGASVVICGQPNVGKSSLLNVLAGKNRVIVTPFAGTTRDVVEEEVQMAGFPVRLTDTAGIRQTDHPIEREGVARSRQAVLSADLVVLVIDASVSLQGSPAAELKELEGKKKIIVLNKCDLPMKTVRQTLESIFKNETVLEISCHTLQGFDKLEIAIGELLGSGAMEQSGEAAIGSLRQKDLITKIAQHIDQALQTCRTEPMPDLVAVDIRAALDNLGMLVGEVYTEDILDKIFSKFCIGK